MTLQRTRNVVLGLSLSLGLCTMGFQCSSPNVTSGKLYYQQYESSKDTIKLNQALAAFQKEIEEKPNSSEGWYWVGFVHGVKKEYVELVEAWRKSEQFGTQMKGEIESNRLYFWGQSYNHGANTFRKAQIRKDKDMFAEAEHAFRAATLLQPDSSAKYGGFVNLAFALIALDRNDEARESLLQQNRLEPNPDAYHILAQLHFDQGNRLKAEEKIMEANAEFQKSMDILNEGLIKFPDETDLNQILLNVFIASNRIVEAKAKFREFAESNPKDKSAQYAFGTVLLETKDFEEAVVFLQNALALDPKYENALYNLCVTYLRWGIHQRDTTDPATMGAEAAAFRKIIEKAIPHIRTLLSLTPESSNHWDLAGKIYASIGMTKEATEAYNKADDLRKGN